MAEPVLMNPWIPVVAAFGGSFITGIINYFMNQANKRSEEKKHQLSLILQSAIENWKQQMDSAHRLEGSGKHIIILPLDAYIIHMSKLTNVLLDKTVSAENIVEKIKEVRKFTDKANKTFKDLEEKGID